MSAYGPSAARRGGPVAVLPSTLAALPPSRSPSAPRFLSIHHFTPQSGLVPPAGFVDYLHAQFQEELARGRTYPQEWPMAREAFGAYFLGGDLFVGIVHARVRSVRGASDHEAEAEAEERERVRERERDRESCEIRETPLAFEDARDNRDWAACVGGAYYVKPNYPGRSSHICNAGFLVPPCFRGIGVATVLARSFLFYAPRLGYKASVFNLVYVNNVASVRIWERLGFEKVGRIPKAGRLRKQVEAKERGGGRGGGQVSIEGEAREEERRDEEGGEEEYVDAWVIYKAFENPDGGDITTMAS